MSQDAQPPSTVHPDSSGLQVVSPPSSATTAPYSTLEVTPDDGKVLNGYYGPRKSEGTECASTMPIDGKTINTENGMAMPEAGMPTEMPTDTEPKSRRRMYIIIGVLVAVVVCVGAILGGVLGSRAAKNSNSSDEATQPSSSPTATATTAIAPKSHLAAAGWQAQGGFTRFLFYQDSNGTLRSSFAAGSGSVADSPWESPKSLKHQFPVKDLTTITTGVIAHTLDNNPTVQLEMFYLNESSVINGINYARALGFGADSINEKKYQALDGSDIAAYWPFIVFQSLEGILQIVQYPWQWTDIKIHAKRKSRLALVPTSRNYTEVANYGRWAIIYQDEDGKLTTLEDPLSQGADKTYSDQSESSKWNSAFPNIKSDDLPSMAAFSVASSDATSSTAVTTFILYQDASGKVQQVWRDGNTNEWKTSTPSVFEGADKGSSLSCVSTPMWPEITGLSERLLEPASDLTHCFFIKGGVAMETQLNGTDWKPSQEVNMGGFD